MSAKTDNARQDRTADAIVDAIERRIARGEFEDWEPLPSERVLMEEFGASRTVVRRVGYDTVLDAINPVIQQLLSDTEGMHNLYGARIFIERGLVRNAAVNAVRTDIQALKSALLANKEAIPDSDTFYATDVAFHRVLYTICGNPIFPAINEGFVSWLAPHWTKMKRYPVHNASIYETHAAIYQAILERDPDAAETALNSHFDIAWEFVKSTFSKDG